jgi:hypothetical protein
MLRQRLFPEVRAHIRKYHNMRLPFINYRQGLRRRIGFIYHRLIDDSDPSGCITGGEIPDQVTDFVRKGCAPFSL